MDVLMPQLGETVAEGKIIKWFKAVGDAVAVNDLLFEIETDKTSMEVPSMSAGTLAEIRVPEGATVPVSAVVAVLSGAGEAPAPAAASAPAPSAPAPVAAPAAAPAPAAAAPAQRTIDPFNAVVSPERNFGPATLANGAKVTPLARRLAAQGNVDLSKLKGSGPHGRIVAADIAKAPAAAPAGGGGSIATGATVDQVKALYADVPYEEVQLDGMRRIIAKRLVESKQTVPHFYLTIDVNLEALLDIRKRINASGAVKISVNDFVVKAYALALQKVPAANAVWAEDRILQFQRSDVGVAVAIEGGLFTPVIRSADTKSLSAISAEIRELAGRAKDRKLKPAEYQGGSAAVSNLGMMGVREFAAIVNPPHATILAVGAGERRPVETADGGVRFESQMTVTLSVDHRVVDGALGAELLAAFKAIMENPIVALI
jgi:pyruvate dehydrogenase E2 component (dihydrolipoamide acetyltransferase)